MSNAFHSEKGDKMDIMLDLETLGTKAGCVILSIGAVAFDPKAQKLPKPENSALVFYQNLTIFDQLMLGMSVETSTIEWWQLMSDEAKAALVSDQINLQGALFRFANWANRVPDYSIGKVWANSPEFDCSIMEYSAQAVGVDMPWSFRDKCDLRTLKRTAEACGISFDAMRAGVHHNALDDCFHQAEIVQLIMKGLTSGTQTEN